MYDAFAEKLKVAVAKLKIGNGLEEGTTTGPLIDEKAVAKVQEHIADALSKGATLLAGGKVMEGNFFEPTILTNVPKNAAVAKEETFGPLAPLFRFKDEAEVIAMSNDTEFGLASYFYARDLGRVFRVAEALEYGMVGVNTGLISNEVAPFGGIKASGLGREGSKYGIEDYLKSNTSAWASNRQEIAVNAKGTRALTLCVFHTVLRSGRESCGSRSSHAAVVASPPRIPWTTPPDEWRMRTL